MRSSCLLVAVLALSWLAAAEAFIVLGAAVGAAALALGGLAALKGAAIVGYAAGRHHRRYHGRSYGHGYYKKPYYGRSYGHHYRYGRSVDTVAEETEDILLSTVGRIDPNGCILRLVCQLQAKDVSLRTLEEELLVGMFANGTDSLTSANTAFVYASNVGFKTRDAASCKKLFPRCPLADEELTGLLQLAWGCGGSAFEETAEEPQEETEQGGPTAELVLA